MKMWKNILNSRKGPTAPITIQTLMQVHRLGVKETYGIWPKWRKWQSTNPVSCSLSSVENKN